VHEFDIFEYQSHTQCSMIDFVIRPGDSEALYQPGQKILPPLDHLFGGPEQGTSGPDFAGQGRPPGMVPDKSRDIRPVNP
jgi:hypothetical protein